MLLIIFLICILCSDVSCFSYYLKRIPNGRNVKNPCDPKGMWRGVGHWNSKGGGKNNPFGEDFKKEGNGDETERGPHCVFRRKISIALLQKNLQKAATDDNKMESITRVPTKETTFACMIYNLPRDKDYHIVAMEPITQNRDIVHHFVVYGCDTTYEVGLRKRAFECDNMPPSLCEDPIMIVSAGLETTCLNPEAGFLIGKNGYRQVLMQGFE
ncbi:hypothetical protein KUTeg_000102 [Tegillarca granosa]|uniref:Uncharacterized protein n=1 Tax=Tegillarca granosa TaxID=220873 RepID=A0ABQ9FY01_TEGGR|nr:hypothetical protein KUTeg_000102 [Tegillarca granosa]